MSSNNAAIGDRTTPAQPRANSPTVGPWSIRDSTGATQVFTVTPLQKSALKSYLWALIPVIAGLAIAAAILALPAHVTHGKALTGALVLGATGVLFSLAWAKGIHSLNNEITSLNRQIAEAQQSRDHLVGVYDGDGVYHGHFRSSTIAAKLQTIADHLAQQD